VTDWKITVTTSDMSIRRGILSLGH